MCGIPVNSKTINILADVVQANKNFEDPEFPHKIDSICPNSQHPKYDVFQKAIWSRPPIFTYVAYDRIRLFDIIEAVDVRQYFLETSYLDAAMSASAMQKRAINNCFLNRVENKFGVYGTRLFIDGVQTEVVVDDYFPIEEHPSKVSLFGIPNGRELWVIVLQKAFAKTFKSYTSLENGEASEAFEIMHGCPCQVHQLSGA